VGIEKENLPVDGGKSSEVGYYSAQAARRLGWAPLGSLTSEEEEGKCSHEVTREVDGEFLHGPENDSEAYEAKFVAENIDANAYTSKRDPFPGDVFLDPLAQPAGFFVAANVASIEDLFREVNGDAAAEKKTNNATGKNKLDKGEFAIIDSNGTPQIVVGPGYFNIVNTPVITRKWVVSEDGAPFKLNAKHVQHGSFHLVNIPEGSLGLAWEDNKAVILQAGRHVRVSDSFQLSEVVSVMEMKVLNQGQANALSYQHIKLGTKHIVQILNGYCGLARRGSVPIILKPGAYAIDDPSFVLTTVVATNEAHIQHDNYHVVNVREGCVAKVFIDNEAHLLEAGTHNITSENFEYDGIAELKDPVITHGPITRFRLDQGKIQKATWNGVPLLLQKAGIYFIKDTNFILKGAVSADELEIVNESRKIITVRANWACVSRYNGFLKLLQPGRHHLYSAGHIAEELVSTKQEEMHLESDIPADRAKYPGFCVFTLADQTPILVKSEIYFRVENVGVKALRLGKQEKMLSQLADRARALLNAMVSSCTIADVTNLSKASEELCYMGDEALESSGVLGESSSVEPSAPRWYADKLHELRGNLHDYFAHFGIKISNITIDQVTVLSKEIVETMAKSTVDANALATETGNRLKNIESAKQLQDAELEKERDLRLQEAQRDADVADINLGRTEKEVSARTLVKEAEITMEKQEKSIEGDVRLSQKEREAAIERTIKKNETDQDIYSTTELAKAESGAAEDKADAITKLADAENHRAKQALALEIERVKAYQEIGPDAMALLYNQQRLEMLAKMSENPETGHLRFQQMLLAIVSSSAMQASPGMPMAMSSGFAGSAANNPSGMFYQQMQDLAALETASGLVSDHRRKEVSAEEGGGEERLSKPLF
jgi:hypothetical protein